MADHVNGALEAVQNRTDNVHANAAAGDFGNFAGGAEARLKNQIGNFRVEQAAHFFGLHQPLLDGFFANAIEIQAMAIIANFDDHLGALVKRIQENRAASAFAGGDTVFAGFDAVIDGIANQVSHGFGEGVENALIEVGVLSGELQGAIFSAMLGNVANHAGKTTEKLFNRNHSNLKN